MTTREENDLLTRTGPGTPMGSLMRRYWLPVLYTHQLPERDGPPVRVKLLSEKLVAFRDSTGRVGLVDERCPHRGASMFFGRNEENGLRCVYHGWKFDVTGQCVDMPSEPGQSNFRNKVAIDAYPCEEHGGVIWTYMGPKALKPPFPLLEWTLVPESHRYATRHIQECNWFQGFEGGFDASHLTFLHRGDVARPLPTKYEPMEMDYGMIFGSARPLDQGGEYWSAEVMLMPFHKLIAFQAGRPRGTHMWVPMDDENCMNWSIEYRPDRPLTLEELDRSIEFRYMHAENIPGTDRCVLNKDNDYGVDRARQKSGESYTGFHGFGIQDCGIQESMGPIVDRTREHLGTSDIHLVRLRRYMLRALKSLEAGEALPGMDPAAYRKRTANFVLSPGETFNEVVHHRIHADSFEDAAAAAA
jgi:phthalate 4,5-dioxygenase